MIDRINRMKNTMMYMRIKNGYQIITSAFFIR